MTKLKRNTEDAIIMAMVEMENVGIPVYQFDPSDDKGGFSFTFKTDLTAEQIQQAKEIAEKYIDIEWPA